MEPSLLSTREAFAAAGWTILVGSLGAVACSLVGCYLVLRRMSLLGDAITHAVLPGIAVAFLLTGQVASPFLFIAAMAMGLLTAALTQALSDWGDVAEDTSLGVVFSSLFAIGVLLMAGAARKVHLDPGCVLYGMVELTPIHTTPVFGVEVPRALVPLAIALALTVAFIALFWKELKIVSFDPRLAATMGISAVLVHYLLMAVVAGVTVAAFEQVGSILVVAMLIVPAATARLLTERLATMMLLAAATAVLSTALGYIGALAFDTSVAGMMAVAAGLLFGLAVVVSPTRGLLAQLARRLNLALRVVGEDRLAQLYRAEEAGVAAPEPGAAGILGWMAESRLSRRGEIARGAEGRIRLTASGRNRARGLVRAHRLWESYLGEHFDLPLDHLHAPAERVEHFLGPELQERLAAELAGRGEDPHGRPIPPAEPGATPGTPPAAPLS